VSINVEPLNDTPDPILSEPTRITIAGAEYTVRRMGLPDVFRVSRILGRGVALLGGGADGITGAQVLQVLIASLSANEDEVLRLIASLLSVDRKVLDDPSAFPMDSIIDVFQALAEHQDLKAFLSKVQTLSERLPEMRQNRTATA
jgi:hypothetical protein